MDNTAQIESWNGAPGQKWARDADQLDQMLAPFAGAVLAAARPVEGERVIDIGCGAGALSLALAQQGADVTGVDVSVPLVELARRRASEDNLGVRFIVADASAWRPAEPAQLLVSRFGVMFFADPAAAFANLRAAMAPGGRMVFACWRPLTENEWALLPVQTALPFLKTPPAASPPGAPGPFGFADRAFVGDVLARAGWSNVVHTPWDGTIRLPGAKAEETAKFMMDIGPLSRALADQGIDLDTVKQALVERVGKLAGVNGETHLKAAAWIVEASA
ncbi:class I SAM-dependent methyltransferase [Hyphomonas sp.]|uniref:class I SAM-dependent methyltransferase n=1 Tax=Hyphomonas sp. TaxID=87 RepID=UPI00391A3333